MAPEPVLTDMNPRLEAAARDVADAKDNLKAKLELRNELVVTAVDAGMSQRAVARAAGISLSRITALLLAGGAEPAFDEQLN